MPLKCAGSRVAREPVTNERAASSVLNQQENEFPKEEQVFPKKENVFLRGGEWLCCTCTPRAGERGRCRDCSYIAHLKR